MFKDKLKEEQIKGWESYYINYEKLKELAKQTFGGSGTYNNDEEDNDIDDDKQLYFNDIWEKEIDKVNQFTLEKEQAYEERLISLNNHRDDLRSWKISGLPDVNRHIKKLSKDYENLANDAALLLQFVAINAIGFKNIIRKIQSLNGDGNDQLIILQQSGLGEKINENSSLTKIIFGIQKAITKTYELQNYNRAPIRIKVETPFEDLNLDYKDADDDPYSSEEGVYRTGASSNESVVINEHLKREREILTSLKYFGLFFVNFTFINLILSADYSFVPCAVLALYPISAFLVKSRFVYNRLLVNSFYLILFASIFSFLGLGMIVFYNTTSITSVIVLGISHGLFSVLTSKSNSELQRRDLYRKIYFIESLSAFGVIAGLTLTLAFENIIILTAQDYLNDMKFILFSICLTHLGMIILARLVYSDFREYEYVLSYDTSKYSIVPYTDYTKFVDPFNHNFKVLENNYYKVDYFHIWITVIARLIFMLFLITASSSINNTASLQFFIGICLLLIYIGRSNIVSASTPLLFVCDAAAFCIISFSGKRL